MDINYFLLLKGKYNSMLSSINEIIETCGETNKYKETNTIFYTFV